MSIRDELASLLDRHLSDRDNAQGCRLACGYDGDDRCEHLADAILARFAVVELPEPNGSERNCDELTTYWSGPKSPYGCSVVECGDLVPGIAIQHPEWTLDPNVVRALAAALLAAANRAEAQS